MQAPAEVLKGYEKAQAAVALRAANEAAVAAGKDADSELLAAYMAYTKREEAQGDPARVQVPPAEVQAEPAHIDPWRLGGNAATPVLR